MKTTLILCIVTSISVLRFIDQAGQVFHVKTVDGKIAGHIDDLTIKGGMILKLPDIQ